MTGTPQGMVQILFKLIGSQQRISCNEEVIFQLLRCHHTICLSINRYGLQDYNNNIVVSWEETRVLDSVGTVWGTDINFNAEVLKKPISDTLNHSLVYLARRFIRTSLPLSFLPITEFTTFQVVIVCQTVTHHPHLWPRFFHWVTSEIIFNSPQRNGRPYLSTQWSFLLSRSTFYPRSGWLHSLSAHHTWIDLLARLKIDGIIGMRQRDSLELKVSPRSKVFSSGRKGQLFIQMAEMHLYERRRSLIEDKGNGKKKTGCFAGFPRGG